MEFNGTAYIATYHFTLNPAWLSQQRITYRYWICLYDDGYGLPNSISQRSAASIDVVSWAAQAAGGHLPVQPWCGCRFA